MLAKTEICLEAVKLRRILCKNFCPKFSIDFQRSCSTIHRPKAKQIPLSCLSGCLSRGWWIVCFARSNWQLKLEGRNSIFTTERSFCPLISKKKGLVVCTEMFTRLLVDKQPLLFTFISVNECWCCTCRGYPGLTRGFFRVLSRSSCRPKADMKYEMRH